MNEENIIGPLTFKQTLFAVSGIGISYLLLNNLESSLSFPLMAFVVAVTVILIFRNKSIEIDEKYIKARRFKYSSKTEYDKWLQKKIAMIVAQIEIRKIKGLTPDPHLEKLLSLFKSALQEQ
ncbi:MAG: hypothetical protein RLZZ67_562 [Candidatus Parcubacteria bacterium]|jgi:hypothetical protein